MCLTYAVHDASYAKSNADSNTSITLHEESNPAMLLTKAATIVNDTLHQQISILKEQGYKLI